MTSPVELLGPRDPIIAWGGEALYADDDVERGARPPIGLRGAAAAVQEDPSGTVRMFRDPMGLGKLFWAPGANGRIRVASRPSRLIAAGCSLDDVDALPRGSVVELRPGARTPGQTPLPSPDWPGGERQGWSLDRAAAAIRKALDSYLAAVAAAHPGRRAYVCLSGGLDSSTIAVLARRHFSDLAAVSFDLRDDAAPPSDDRLAAERLSSDLGMPLIHADATAQELLAWLDLVLLEGIDWRAFNVHAALVNAALASAIRDAAPDGGHDPPLVLTGDLSNEFLVDYSPEQYRGETHYPLPRVAAPQLRSILVQGLDTCHREVGIFAAWGLPLVQPFVAALDTYLAIPRGLLESENGKAHLMRATVGGLLPEYIYQRPKVRAQTGSREGGGVLACCIDNGIDQAWLRNRFASLHGVGDQAALDKFIRGGRYRASVPDWSIE